MFDAFRTSAFIFQYPQLTYVRRAVPRLLPVAQTTRTASRAMHLLSPPLDPLLVPSEPNLLPHLSHLPIRTSHPLSTLSRPRIHPSRQSWSFRILVSNQLRSRSNKLRRQRQRPRKQPFLSCIVIPPHARRLSDLSVDLFPPLHHVLVLVT